MPEGIKKATERQYKYDAQNCVRINMKLNVTTDAAILTKLSRVPSMSGYIRSVILEDIRRNDPDLLSVKRFVKDADSVSLGRISPAPEDTLILPGSGSINNPVNPSRKKSGK